MSHHGTQQSHCSPTPVPEFMLKQVSLIILWIWSYQFWWSRDQTFPLICPGLFLLSCDFLSHLTSTKISALDNPVSLRSHLSQLIRYWLSSYQLRLCNLCLKETLGLSPCVPQHHKPGSEGSWIPCSPISQLKNIPWLQRFPVLGPYCSPQRLLSHASPSSSIKDSPEGDFLSFLLSASSWFFPRVLSLGSQEGLCRSNL